jgi:hypothetical protein
MHSADLENLFKDILREKGLDFKNGVGAVGASAKHTRHASTKECDIPTCGVLVKLLRSCRFLFRITHSGARSLI